MSNAKEWSLAIWCCLKRFWARKQVIVGRWTRVYVALTFSWLLAFLCDVLGWKPPFLTNDAWRSYVEVCQCQSTAVILQGAEQKDSEVSISRCSRLSSHTYSMHVNSYKYVYAYTSPIVCLFMPMAACSLLNSIITRIHTSYPYTADLDLGLSWWWLSVSGDCSRSCSLGSGFAGWFFGISTCLWLCIWSGCKKVLLIF